MEHKSMADEQPVIRMTEQDKRPYEAPRILSDEPLEVAAALCNPPSGGFGKSHPVFPCTASSGS